MKLFSFVTLLLISISGKGFELKAFEATYDISRGGKKTAEQHSKLTQTDVNKWRIEDQITGTNGLASVIGFSRTEITEFTLKKDKLQAFKHQMLQKAAFSRKQYSFKWNPTTSQFDIEHKDKNVHFKPSDSTVISSQLMPLALAIAACNQQNTLDLNVLKNKKTKVYHFALEQQPFLSAHRVYDSGVIKKSKSKLDADKQCLPVEQFHQEQDEPEIETTMVKFSWL